MTLFSRWRKESRQQVTIDDVSACEGYPSLAALEKLQRLQSDRGHLSAESQGEKGTGGLLRSIRRSLSEALAAQVLEVVDTIASAAHDHGSSRRTEDAIVPLPVKQTVSPLSQPARATEDSISPLRAAG